MKWLLALFLLGFASSAWATPTADCTFTHSYRTGTTATAPHTVFVDCSATTSDNPNVVPFHSLRYFIDYDDSDCASGQGTWDYSPTQARKGFDYPNPIGGHVYECAGTYTIEVSIEELGEGGVSAAGDTITETFTVESEDSGWPGDATTCVSTTGDFAGCPAGALEVTSNDFDDALVTTAGSRTLFNRCEGVYYLWNEPALASALGNMSLVGSYGNCPSGPVDVQVDGSSDKLQGSLAAGSSCVWQGAGIPLGECLSTLSGWIFRDIHFTSIGSTQVSLGHGTTILSPESNYVVEDLLLLRVSLIDVAECRHFERLQNEATSHERLAWVSTHCRMRGSNLYSAGDYAQNYISGNDILIINSWDELIGTLGNGYTWGSRHSGLQHYFWAHSKVTVSGDIRFTNQYRTAFGDAGLERADHNNVVTDLQIFDMAGSAGGDYRPFNLWYKAGESGDPDLNKADWIFDGIFYARTYSTAAGFPSTDFIMFNINSARTTIRNCVIDVRGITSAINASLMSPLTSEVGTPGITDIWVYNNTMIRNSNTAGNMYACNLSGATVSGARCFNNLLYDAHLSETNTTITSGTFETTPANNVHLRAFSEGCPFTGRTGSCDLSSQVPSPNPWFDWTEFKIRASGGSRALVVDQGLTMPDVNDVSDYLGWVSTDAWHLLRHNLGVFGSGGTDSLTDIGAHEYGSIDYYDSASSMRGSQFWRRKDLQGGSLQGASTP